MTVEHHRSASAASPRADAFEHEVAASVAAADGSVLATISRRVEADLEGDTEADGDGAGMVAVVTVNGALDLDTAPLLRAALLQAVEQWPTAYCDLGAVTCFGAVGANILLDADERARALGHVFAVRGAAGMTRRVLRIFGLDQTIAGMVTRP
jgi:anti-anti-sigma factor